MVPEWMQAAVLGGVFLTSMHTNLILSGWDRQLQTLGLIHALQSITLSCPTLLSCLPLIRDQLVQFYDFCPSDRSYSP